MTRPIHHARLLRIALMAIVGSCAVAGEATACGPKAGTAGRSCCGGETAAKCGGCCEQRATKPPIAVRPVVAVATPRAELVAPACDCRADEPGAPAARAEAPIEPGRPVPNHGGVISTVSTSPAARRIAPPARGADPPRPRIYLLISRILI